MFFPVFLLLPSSWPMGFHGRSKGERARPSNGEASLPLSFSGSCSSSSFIFSFSDIRGFIPTACPGKRCWRLAALPFCRSWAPWPSGPGDGRTKSFFSAWRRFCSFLPPTSSCPARPSKGKRRALCWNAIVDGITQNTVIIADDETVRAVCWYCKRSDVYLLGGGGELTYGLAYKDAKGRGIDLQAAMRADKGEPGKNRAGCPAEEYCQMAAAASRACF